jgi:cytochrome c2
MKLAFPIAAALLALAAAVPAHADGDVEAGKVVFKKCAICHRVEAGKNFLGPSLFGVVGRKSATEPGFSYSDAMKKADKTWDPAALDVYLTNPKALVPGTKMIFPGLPKADDRANVIAYLATLK